MPLVSQIIDPTENGPTAQGAPIIVFKSQMINNRVTERYSHSHSMHILLSIPIPIPIPIPPLPSHLVVQQVEQRHRLGDVDRAGRGAQIAHLPPVENGGDCL